MHSTRPSFPTIASGEYLERKLAGTKDQETIARLASQIVDRQHSLELILAKNRSGPTRTLSLWCDVASSSIAQTARGLG